MFVAWILTAAAKRELMSLAVTLVSMVDCFAFIASLLIGVPPMLAAFVGFDRFVST